MDRSRRQAAAESIELRELEYFLAVAEELNFTRAAERLHIAQQALSAAIRKLEDTLGVALFTRSTRHVALTTAGETLVHGARRVLDAASEAVERVREVTAGRAGRLVIGFSTAAGTVPAVRAAIRGFSQHAPDVDLRLVEHDFADPSAGLNSGATQLAFIFGPLPADDLASITLVAEQRLVALPADHPLASRESVTARDLTGLRWLRVPAQSGAWTDFWFRHPLGEGQTGPEIRTADEWVPAIEAGRGAAFTMPTVMKSFPNTQIATVPVVDLPPGTVLLAWHRSNEDPLVRAFVASVREALPA